MDYKKTYKKIERRYIIIAMLLIIFFIVGQVIIQNQINYGEDMASVINISGRQRMLSQKITKDVLMLYENPQSDAFNYYLKDLEESLETFENSHTDLINGNEARGIGVPNSKAIIMMFTEIDPYFNKVVESANKLASIAKQDFYQSDEIFEEIQLLSQNEKFFLEKMNQIVFQYEAEADKNVIQLGKTVKIVFYLIILAILMIAALILLPATKTMRHAFININERNKNIEKMFQIMKGALFLVNESGDIIMQNSDAQKMTLLTKTDNNHIEKSIKWLDIDINDCIKRVQLGEKIDKIEAKIENGEGEILTMLVAGVRAKYNQEDIVLISAYDISDQKKAEEILKNKADKDELTGLYNRHFLEGIIAGEIERSKRYQYPLSAAILDIDDFKIINDTWGHPVGDLVLKEIAQLLINNSRESDFPLRIGGEEFVILMPHTNLEGAYKLAEKIRKIIEANVHPVAGKYTVSFGVAQKREGEDYLGLYNRIDGALYQAKAQGKNCVVQSTNKEKDVFSLAWKDSWQSGEEGIDQQHQQLLMLIDEIIGEKNKAGNSETLMDNLDCLIKESKDHFNYEEGVLKEIGYVHYLEHQKIHANLLEKAYDLKTRTIKGEIDYAEVLDFMFHDLVVGHILRDDTKFFEEIEKSKMTGY